MIMMGDSRFGKLNPAGFSPDLASRRLATPSLQNFVQVFEIDPFLVQAAAEASPDLKKALSVD